MVLLLEEVARAVEMWLKLRRKPQPFVDPDLDPVLLVPGVAGSILTAVDIDNSEKAERVWVRLFEADYKLRTKLWSRYDPSTGKSVSLDPKSRIVVPEDRYGLYAIDSLDPDLLIGRELVYYFHDMIVEMVKWGFEEGKTLFGFGYDFRQSNRLPETLSRFAKRLESVFEASGRKKITVISHSMGGLLVKCFMALHSDVFEKYVKNWIAIAAPFQGAPGYVISTLLNGMSFVQGWEENFFITKWNMHQLLIECPSIYELMANKHFQWEYMPLLEIWKSKDGEDGSTHIKLESYPPQESIEVFKAALESNVVDYLGTDIPLPFNMDILHWALETMETLFTAEVPSSVKFYNIYGTSLQTPHSVCYGSEEMPVADLQDLRFLEPIYVCVDGDGTVPTESSKADGLKAEARIGVPAEHRGILADHHVFRILQHWLGAGDPDPFYNPLNDYVILPTSCDIQTVQEKCHHQEEWEVIAEDIDDKRLITKSLLTSMNLTSSSTCNNAYCVDSDTTMAAQSQSDSKQQIEINALSVTVDA